MNVGNHRHKNIVSGSVLCWHDTAESAKSADIWLSGRHVANMSATLPAKLFDDKEIFDCLVKLPCLISCKKQKQQTSKNCRRSNDGSINDQCYLNLPEDMVEDKPLDIENMKEKKDEDNDLQQYTTRHP